MQSCSRLQFCISDKLQGDHDVTFPWTTLQVAEWSESIRVEPQLCFGHKPDMGLEKVTSFARLIWHYVKRGSRNRSSLLAIPTRHFWASASAGFFFTSRNTLFCKRYSSHSQPKSGTWSELLHSDAKPFFCHRWLSSQEQMIATMQLNIRNCLSYE